MPDVTVATWNVNSIKARAPHVFDWLQSARPSVLGLQELKAVEEVFPPELCAGTGYQAAVFGQKTWNGVALLAREPLSEVVRGLPGMADDPQARFLSARWNGIRLVNVYVPNGESIESEKFRYKMRWLRVFREFLDSECDPEEPLAIFGDFNIAPEDRDVYDPEGLREKVLCSTPEREALRALLDWGLVDLFRQFNAEEKQYSWWDYRMAAFRRNLGMRIDLILVTRTLAERALACAIDVAPRRLDRPSDHTPVVATFRL